MKSISRFSCPTEFKKKKFQKNKEFTLSNILCCSGPTTEVLDTYGSQSFFTSFVVDCPELGWMQFLQCFINCWVILKEFMKFIQTLRLFQPRPHTYPYQTLSQSPAPNVIIPSPNPQQRFSGKLMKSRWRKSWFQSPKNSRPFMPNAQNP